MATKSKKSDNLIEEFSTTFHTPYGYESVEKLPRLIIALQYCPIDKKEAIELMELLADIEDEPRYDVVFAISYRNDCRPPEPHILAEFKKKFPDIVLWNGFRDDRGHPAGCNGLWIDTMTHATEEGERRNISGIFTMESDDYPIRKDWINRLRKEWLQGRIYENKRVIGHLMPKGLYCPEHINGNALFDTQLLRYMQPVSQCPPNHAWDVWGAKYFRAVWKDSKFIRNLYREKEVSLERIVDLQRDDVAIIHGVKDDSVINVVKKVLTTK